jgi:hypothetical protein
MPSGLEARAETDYEVAFDSKRSNLRDKPGQRQTPSNEDLCCFIDNLNMVKANANLMLDTILRVL